jgi:outer membrane protein assembly factor BamB
MEKKKIVFICSCLILVVISLSADSFYAPSLVPGYLSSPVKTHVQDLSGDWPTYLYDQERTGANLNEIIITSTTASNLQLAWKILPGGIIGASPTMVNGVMYIGTWNGYEYAIDLATQQVLWQQYLGVSVQSKKCYGSRGIGIDSTAVVDNNVVFVGGGDGYMYALSTIDGSVIWKTLLGNPPYYNWSSPLLYNSKLYIGLAAYCDPPFVQGKVMALNESDGTLAASISLVPDGQTGAPVWSSPAVDVNTNTIYVTTGNNGSKNILKQPNADAILALDADTLAITDSWQVPASERISDGDFGATPTLFDVNGASYIGALNKNGIYYVLNRYDLAAGPVWELALSSNSHKIDGDNVSSSCYNNGVIYAGSAGGVNGEQTYGGTIGAYDAVTGNVLWSTITAGKMVSPVTCTSDLVVDNQGKIVEVRDASTGNILFSYATNARLYGASVISNGVLYTPSTDGSIYAFTIQ